MAKQTKATPPAGYEARSEDVVGYYDHNTDAPIHFIPRHAKTFDSSIDKTKPAILVIGELVDECALRAPNTDEDSAGDEDSIMGQPGDVVGVWYKPGMKGLKGCAGAKTYMTAAGEKDIGKGNPMKLFDVLCERGKGGVLLITEDARNKSARADLPLPVQGGARLTARAVADTTDYSDAPIV